ncbi:MAG TPA: sugar phosphate isomerase/epimerase family protein [Planctomycetota bacterium]|nr:sugar phosphate isomerase/epimerase family protein [Planctomycetota bacterium]
MIKSISYWSFDGGLEGTLPIRDAMLQAKKAGFEAIELCFAAKGVLSPRTTEKQCRQILADAKKIGIRLPSLCTGMYWDYSLTDDKASVRKKAYELTVAYIKAAKMLKVKHVLVVPGAVDVFFKPDFKKVPYEVVWKRSVQQLRKLARVAQKHKVYLCVENVWNKFLLSPVEMKCFLDAVGSPWVGCYFDVGNIMLYGFPQQWIRYLGSRIKRIHFKDFKTSVGTVAGFCDLLAGDVPFAEVMKAFRAVGYDGPCTAEMMPPDPTLLKRTSKAMDKIFTM